MILPYIRLARVDHWFKNVFMIPGLAVVLYVDPALLQPTLIWNVGLALLAAGLVASSNYVLNEVLDAPYDALHPVKKHRPIPSGMITIKYAYAEWILLGVAGLTLAWLLGRPFFYSALALWLMGCVYNVPPVRAKDKPLLDVLSESVNNPLRLLLGWYLTGTALVVPISLVMAYWMLGAFFMGVKRFAEYRRIGDAAIAARYRKSFGYYNQERLLVSVVYYAAAFGLFFGIFLIRYRIELLLTIPFLAGFVAWYIHLGFLEDSPTQYPERLYRQKSFVAYMFLVLFLMVALLFIDIPLLEELFQPTPRNIGW